MAKKEKIEILDEVARRIIREEDERSYEKRGGKEITLGKSSIRPVSVEPSEGRLTETEEDLTQILQRHEPHKLKEMARQEITNLCNNLVDRDWVTQWEIRNILRDLAPTFAKTKYMPGYDKDNKG
jgi:hypothetical protein